MGWTFGEDKILKIGKMHNLENNLIFNKKINVIPTFMNDFNLQLNGTYL